MGLIALLVLVLFADQSIKLLLRRSLGSRTASLGRIGSVRIVSARTWIERVGARNSAIVLFAVWMCAATVLLLLSAWLPASSLSVGLLLGGSLSHALEMSVRGCVTDYVCLRFWPSFNLADVAITAGAIGVVGHVLPLIALGA